MAVATPVTVMHAESCAIASIAVAPADHPRRVPGWQQECAVPRPLAAGREILLPWKPVQRLANWAELSIIFAETNGMSRNRQ